MVIYIQVFDSFITEGLDIYDISYSVPFNALDGTIGVRYLGLHWQPFNGLVLRADYGVPLMGTSDRGSSLQDNGFNFSVLYQPF